jgi:hypothetical protein
MLIGPADGQFTPNNNNKEGFYLGGICQDESSLCGVWYLKKDSSFLYIQTGSDSIIRVLGIGTWSAPNDSSIRFSFQNLKELQLLGLEIEYHGSTGKSYDTSYLSITVKGADRLKPFQLKTISFSEITKTTRTNKAGICNINFHRKEKVTYFTILNRSENYYPVKVSLLPNVNVHEINITVPKIDALSCFYIEEFSVGFSITSKKIMGPVSIKKISDKNDEFLSALNKAKEKQPLLRGQINHLITKLLE